MQVDWTHLKRHTDSKSRDYEKTQDFRKIK